MAKDGFMISGFGKSIKVKCNARKGTTTSPRP